MRAAVVDYGAGNLRSVGRALEHVGFQTRLVTRPEELEGEEVIVLPGVGAFGPAVHRLREAGFVDALRAEVERGRWLVGLCLGMQLLFEESEEEGRHEGLGFLRGRVVRLPAGLKVPHMGWNTLEFDQPSPITAAIRPGSHVYFVHSYYVLAEPSQVVAWTEYGVRIPAIVAFDRVVGFQFHPEKSSRVGLALLRGLREAVRVL
ncbi:MAG: imidazole glycerol phosphate synthase subunit HisH [Armatimonadota bacterium]|nr:imidazole glycerol phosphate synthase subunit HisH [Armatimonadota bacterium]MDR7440035.1 imidazole glycerol phosphate synthase subunit HisH [Armatimonadota bacterium]MDR7562494.1 imidazole glycerol phosphate synthase subunit HisH [Armatimonadota bacterium]MDR7566807.1 imidazole glycerol phosphate synthase subunit HisH [Armatimonadota bacterium]MDR7601378.1 imidazole glycerol phosphate synthase subunit HisH [Armatimonadota bacterium]